MRNLISILEGMGFTPEAVSDQLYSSGSFNGGSLGRQTFQYKDIEDKVGRWTVIDPKSINVLRDEWLDKPNEELLYYFHDEGGRYLYAKHVAGSYGREDWTQWIEVYPEKKTIEIYEFTD